MNEPTPGRHMATEIAAQPGIFAELITRRATVSEVARKIVDRKPRFALLAARGSSDHAALYAKYALEILFGLPVGLVSPSTMTLYGARPDFSDVLLITVSQSGESPDLLQVTETARARGAITVAFTNTESAPLNELAEFAINVNAGTEHAVAATKTYTATLLALYLLVDAMRAGNGEAVRPLPELASTTLDSLGTTESIDAAVSHFRDTSRMVVTGRGYSLATAFESALKLAETSYLPARAYSGADLLHGPVAAIDEDTSVMLVCSSGVGAAAMHEVAREVRQRNADVCVIGSAARELAAGVRVELPECAEEIAPILEILPIQRLALQLAIARGVNPDQPRGLGKVTRTH